MSGNIFDKSLIQKLCSEVHVWYCKPDNFHDVSNITAFKSVLSAQEAERYERFHYDKDRHGYLVSHALLRHALSKYVDVNASSWQFSCDARGKPELQHAVTVDSDPLEHLIKDSTLRFNLTHTDGLCACVIAFGRACGIDAEYVHRQSRQEVVARRMFAEEEIAVLNDSADASHQFYEFWTLREAYVKALGVGLSGASKDYYFSLNAEGNSAIINFKKYLPGDIKRWQFYLVEPTDEHCLAVAFESAEGVSVHASEFVF